MNGFFTLKSIAIGYGVFVLSSVCCGETLPIRPEPGGTQYHEKKKPAARSSIDVARKVAGSRVASAAQWVDRFFENPEYQEEEADARISLRQSVKFSQESNAEFQTRLSGSLSLPHFSRRVKLVFEGNDEPSIDEQDEPDLRASADESIETSSVGLQYTPVSRNDYDFRVGAGMRISDTSLYIGPRWRFQTQWGSNWRGRFTQRLRWYSDEGWRAVTGVDVDCSVRTRNLIRQNFSTDWREGRFSQEGFRHTTATSFVQPLSDTKALRYTWSSDYLTRPDKRWVSSVLAASYRSSLLRDWILLEFRPFVSWEEDLGWEINPGILISMSIIIEDEELTPQPHIQ